MIVTVTPNPSLDRTLEVAELVRGEVLRADARRVEPGGKGINVARALHASGHSVRAVLPSGGHEGDHLVALLAAAGLDPVVVPVDGAVRENVAIVEPDGTVTKVNEPGPQFDAAATEALLAATAAAAADARWVVGSGSLPPGAPEGLYADLVRRVRDAGGRVAIDTSGDALAAAVDAGPDLVKPNHDELAAVTGVAVRTFGDVVAAARTLLDRGVGTALVSLGADGALLVDRHGVVHAERAVDTPRSSVGAGDATLAGYLTAADADRATALRTAVAFGAAAVSLPGSQMPGPQDVQPELVVVDDQPGLDRALVTGLWLGAASAS